MSSTPTPRGERVLLTGATGYVGGGLLEILEPRGVRLRCMVRSPEKLSGHADSTEVIQGDLLEESEVARALEGIHTAYYLAHSMGGERDFVEADRRAARIFARAAREAGVRKIIYLGGLGKGDALSPHLASRHEVGEILRGSGVPTLEFRSGIIIGRGSLSFELISALVQRLPVMVAPKWVSVETQPIAVADVLRYLTDALDLPLERSEILEIGGPDRVSYRQMMLEYAMQAGYRRRILPVPVLTPWLSSLWLGLVTPVQARVGRKLIDSVRNETVVDDERARVVFGFRPRGIAQAIEEARSGLATSPPATGKEPMIIEYHRREVGAPASRVYREFASLGGERGWPSLDWAWRIRGLLDRMVGGEGMRRGRRHPDELVVGDAVDFWRVEAVEPGRSLRMIAEMKLPGTGWLEFSVEPRGERASVLEQKALFEPRGWWGRVYWGALFPFHSWIFRRMIRKIARRAERAAV